MNFTPDNVRCPTLILSPAKSLLQAAKLAHSRYQADFEVKRKLKEDEERAKLLKQSEDAKKMLCKMKKTLSLLLFNK